MKGKEIFDHFLVPKHEVVSEKEIEAIKKLYNAELSQFPKIYVDDPAAKAIGAKAGEVVKITRASPTAGSSIYYRYVIARLEKISGFESEEAPKEKISKVIISEIEAENSEESEDEKTDEEESA